MSNTKHTTDTLFIPPTHLFLVNVLPGEDLPTKPPLPGMPDPVHSVHVWSWSLNYVGGLDSLEDEIDPLVDVVPSTAAAAIMERRRLNPWTQAKRTVVAALDRLYTTPDWSITWATTRQAHAGRGRWRGHAAVLDHVADWSRDRGLELLEGVNLPEGEVALELDSALADNGADPRNWVGLGSFTRACSRLPDLDGIRGADLTQAADYGARWITWH